MKKETRAERLKRRSHAIRNSTGDSNLASRAKHWSDKRILEELGVRVPKKTPVLKPLPDKKTKRRKARRVEKYQYGISVGLEVEEAIKLKQYKNTRIKASQEYIAQRKLSKKMYNKPKTKEARITLWKNWAESNNLPPAVHKQARDINRELSTKNRVMDDTDRYGYAVAFYMFIENEAPEDIMENRIKIDRYDGNRYIEVVRRA